MFLRSLALNISTKPQASRLSVREISHTAHVAAPPTSTPVKNQPLPGQASSNYNINRAFAQRDILSEPSAAIQDYILRESQSLVEEARESQIRGGYNVDNWQLQPLGGIQILLQSLAFGKDSLVTLPNLTNDDFDDYIERCKQGKLPPGTSFYFACSMAMSHNYIHGNMNLDEGVKHYHQYTQVGQKHCTKTGDVVLHHRQYLGIFQNLPEWIRQIPVATSIVAANPVQNITLECGNIKTVSLGDGQARQILVAKSLLPFIHHHAKYIFSHHQGLEKSIKHNDKKILWCGKRLFHNVALLPEVIHVNPEGEHETPVASATATKLSL